MKCTISEHIPREDGLTCECGYFRKENRDKNGIKHSRDTVSNFANFKKDLIQLVIEDVPIYAQERLLNMLDLKKKSNWDRTPNHS